jgi:hypothetical protein
VVYDDNGYDDITKPCHYCEGSKVQPIDLWSEWNLGPFTANIIKYLRRAPRKGNEIEDLKKAQFYLSRLIELKEGGWKGNG